MDISTWYNKMPIGSVVVLKLSLKLIDDMMLYTNEGLQP